MAGLRVEQHTVGPVMTNCYFAINEDTKEALVIDPGDAADVLTERLKERGVKPVAVLLTHGHFDHAHAARAVADAFDAPVYAHGQEQETLCNPSINLSSMMGEGACAYRADQFVTDGQVLHLAGYDIQTLYTPGHTSGGCCYYIEREQAVFVGDTLFHGSVGRTDFPGGSASVLLRSIEEKLLPLPGQTKVYPGHDDVTTIGWERQHNPFLQRRRA